MKAIRCSLLLTLSQTIHYGNSNAQGEENMRNYLLELICCQQIICTIKIRRSPTRHDNIDFRPIITRISNIVPLSVVTPDKGYDTEENHALIRDLVNGFSIIPTRYENVPIWKTHGRYRNQMKRGYSKLLYSQRNKNFSNNESIENAKQSATETNRQNPLL